MIDLRHGHERRRETVLAGRRSLESMKGILPVGNAEEGNASLAEPVAQHREHRRLHAVWGLLIVPAARRGDVEGPGQGQIAARGEPALAESRDLSAPTELVGHRDPPDVAVEHGHI